MKTSQLGSSIKKIAEYLQGNQLKEAEMLLNAIGKKWPDCLEAHNLRGVLNFKKGEYPSAVHAFNQYLSIDPKNTLVLNNLAASYEKSQNPEKAKSTLREAIKLNKQHVNSYLNLMSIELSQKNFSAVIKIYDKVQKLRSGVACNIIAAAAFRGVGRPLDAKKLLKAYLSAYQNDMDALNNLANVERELGNLKEAKKVFESLILKDPEFLEAKLNLAITLDALDEFKTAEKLLQAVAEKQNLPVAEVTLSQIYYRRGHHKTAIKRLETLLSKKQLEGEVSHELGTHLYKLKEYKSAITHLNKASQHGYVTDQYWNVKALCEEALGNYEEAVNVLRKCLQKNPKSNAALNNLGRIYITLCDPERGLEFIRKAYLQQPDRKTAYSNFLFNLHYDPKIPPADIYNYSVKVGSAISSRAVKKYGSWPCIGVKDPLTIAFYSPDFNKHPVGFLIEEVLRELKARSVRLVAISGSNKDDDQTQKLKALFSQWICVKGVGADVAAQKVFVSNPHALVDLAGYTDGGLLELFAYKSAPVQIEWMGYLSTTGLPEMDYFLADETTAKDSSHFFSEEVVRLKGCHLNYWIPEFRSETGPPPLLSKGYATLGSFNNISKINDSVIALWSTILNKIDNSILKIQAKHTEKAYIKNVLLREFEASGVNSDRIDVCPPVSSTDYLGSYRTVDVCLDTFPYTGGKTTLDSIFMGVPVVTLNGESHFAKNSASILTTISHPELIASDQDEYVRIVDDLCSHPAKLSDLRKSLRNSYLSSFSRNPAIICDALIQTVRGKLDSIASSLDIP